MLYLTTFIVFGLAMAGMALGVLLGRPPIAGSCGRECGCRPAARDTRTSGPDEARRT